MLPPLPLLLPSHEKNKQYHFLLNKHFLFFPLYVVVIANDTEENVVDDGATKIR